MSSPAPDPAKLAALLANPNAAAGYRTWIDGFLIPLMQRIGLKVVVRRGPDKYTITIKLP